MSVSPPPPADPAPPSRLSRLDLVAGLALLVVGIVAGVVVRGEVSAIPAASAFCTDLAASGTMCAPTVLVTASVLGLAVPAVVWLLGAILFALRLRQRRRAWIWPLLALVAMILAVWAAIALVGLYLPPMS